MGDDYGRLSPGWESTLPRDPEAPEHASPERARHWVRFYSELVEFETRILNVMRESVGGMPADETEMVRLSNIEPLQKLIAEFARRRDMWAEAARERN